MPFRVPFGYESIAVSGDDPKRADVVRYALWLEAELKLARTWLAAHPALPPSPKPTKEPPRQEPTHAG